MGQVTNWMLRIMFFLPLLLLFLALPLKFVMRSQMPWLGPLDTGESDYLVGIFTSHFMAAMIPFLYLLIFFGIFFVVQEGSRWKKHEVLGVFARIMQASPIRGFLIFLALTVLLVPSIMLLMWGAWTDAIVGQMIPNNTTMVVNLMLIMFLMLSGMFPVMWSSFRTWRQAVRSAADVKVRTTAG